MTEQTSDNNCYWNPSSRKSSDLKSGGFDDILKNMRLVVDDQGILRHMGTRVEDIPTQPVTPHLQTPLVSWQDVVKQRHAAIARRQWVRDVKSTKLVFPDSLRLAPREKKPAHFYAFMFRK